MPAKFVLAPQKLSDQFPIVDDEKLRYSLIGLADQWNDYARSMIYETYNDAHILMLYKHARDTGIFQHGGKSKVRREIIRFPNGFVYEFCKAVFQPMYGRKWMINKKVLRHQLIRPWLLINLI